MTSATVKVEKATSDLLISPDWALNMDICDSVNSDSGQAKDVIKAIKKRLHHKNSTVQFLTLTLLETLMKNCGDYVHQQVQEREILNEMVKIVKKKSDIPVRDKILVLIESWQEAFGGPNGKYPQYYWAYSELKAYGVIFPERTHDDAPIITPPATHPTATSPPSTQHFPSQFPLPSPPQTLHALPSSQQPGYVSQPSYGSPRAGYGIPPSGDRNRFSGYGPHPFYGMPTTAPHPSYEMPVNASLRLDEAMASEMANLSLSDLDSMRSVMELLSEMLKAVNPTDREAVKDEVIADLVSQCRLNEKKLMAFINSTSDEKLLEESLQLNDKLQSLLAKHDAIASRSALPLATEKDRPPAPVLTAPVAVASTSQTANIVVNEEEEEVDDEFAQLARRKPRMKEVSTESSTFSQPSTSTISEPSTSACSNSLSLPEPPAPVKTSSKEEDMINLLSLSLAPQSSSPLTPRASTLTPSSTSNQNPPPITYPGNSYAVSWTPPQPQETLNKASSPNTSLVNQGTAYNAVSWAPPQPQETLNITSSPVSSPANQGTTYNAVSCAPPQSQETLNKTSSPITSPVNQGTSYTIPWVPPQAQPQPQEGAVTSYPPPPWEIDAPADVDSTIPAPTAAVQYPVNSTSQGMRPVQQLGSVELRPNVPGAQPRPSYVSSNTFFGELVDFRNADGTLRTTGSPSYSMNTGRK